MTPAWADRLERRWGFLSVPGLAAFLAGMNAMVAALTWIKPEFPSQINLDPELIRQGQVWRVITYLFIPPEVGPLWLFLWLLLFYAYAQALEAAWGDFKLTLYCAIGALAMAAVSLVSGAPLPNVFFNTSLFLAFARLNPDFEILLFFILPVKMKYLAWLTWALAAWNLLLGSLVLRASVLAGVFNYLLFFGPAHLAELKRAWRRYR